VFFCSGADGLGEALPLAPGDDQRSPSPQEAPSPQQTEQGLSQYWATQLAIFFEKFFQAADKLDMIKIITSKSKLQKNKH